MACTENTPENRSGKIRRGNTLNIETILKLQRHVSIETLNVHTKDSPFQILYLHDLFVVLDVVRR